MQYTITSRGRPIGTTDLGFRYRLGASRMGWFHPNADGERLMPVLAAVTAATRAYAQSIRRRGNGSSVDAHRRDATLLADVAEVYQHASDLDLRLHAADGALIATEIVSIQDTEELPAWDDLDEIMFDPDADGELVFGDGFADIAGPWTSDVYEPDPRMRYQIYVSLVDARAIP